MTEQKTWLRWAMKSWKQMGESSSGHRGSLSYSELENPKISKSPTALSGHVQTFFAIKLDPASCSSSFSSFILCRHCGVGLQQQTDRNVGSKVTQEANYRHTSPTLLTATLSPNNQLAHFLTGYHMTSQHAREEAKRRVAIKEAEGTFCFLLAKALIFKGLENILCYLFILQPCCKLLATKKTHKKTL